MNIIEKQLMTSYYATPQVLSQNGEKMLRIQENKMYSFNRVGDETLEKAVIKNMTTNYQTILRRLLNGYIAAVCGEKVFSIIDDDANIIYQGASSFSLDFTYLFCSFDEVMIDSSTTLYLTGYCDEQSHIFHLSLYTNSGDVGNLPSPVTVEMTGIGTACQFLIEHKQIFCLEFGSRIVSFFDFDLTLTKQITFPYSPIVFFPNHILVRVEEDVIMALLHSSSGLFYTEITFESSSSTILSDINYQKTGIITMAYLAHGSMMFIDSTENSLLIQRIQTKKRFGKAIRIQMTNAIYSFFISIGVFSSNFFGVITKKRSYLDILFLFDYYPTCVDEVKYFLSTDRQTGIDFKRLIDNYDPTETYYIVFKSPNNLPAFALDSPYLIDNDSSNPDSKFTSTVAGYYEVTYTIQTNVTFHEKKTDQMAESFYCKASFKVCHDLCADCDDYGDSTNHKCTKCIEGYLQLVDIPVGNCLTKTYCKALNYYYVGHYCLPKCPPLTYANPTTRECVECPKDFVINEGTKECIEVTTCKQLNYFIRTGQCVKVCASPLYSNKANWECVANCPSDMYIYQSYCITASECFDKGYYQYATESTKTCIDQCPSSVNTDRVNKQCVSTCLSNTYSYTFGGKTECISDCQYYNTITDKINRKCHIACPAEYYHNTALQECTLDCDLLKVEPTSSLASAPLCVDKCPLTHYLAQTVKRCVLHCSTLQLYSNKNIMICESQCPKGKIPNTLTYECRDLADLSIDNILSDTSIIEENIVDIAHKTSIISQGDTTIEFIDTSKGSNGSNDKDKRTDTSTIDLGECEQILRERNEIPKDESLLVMKIDKKPDETQITNQVEYSVYSKNGTKLDLAVCNEAPITITVPIKETPSEDYKEAKQLLEQGIDTNDINDPFFNDICVSFTSSNGTDVPIPDRKKNMYNNNTAQLCQKGCTYKGIDYNENIVKCSCIQTNDTSNDTTPASSSALEDSISVIVDEFFGILIKSNFGVITCYKSVLDISILKHNAGLYLSLVIDIIDGILLGFFFFQGLVPIRVYILKEFKGVINLEYDPPRHNKNNKTIKSNWSLMQLNINNSNCSNRSNRNKSSQSHIKCYISKKSIFNNLPVKPTNTIIPQLHYSYDDLDEMSFKDAIQHDNRTLFVFYYRYLQRIHPLLDIFIVYNPQRLKFLVYSQFFFGILMDFALSALFYSDKFITNNNLNGQPDFWYNIPISIFTYIFGGVINVLLNMLSSSESRLKKIKDKSKPGEIMRALVSFMKLLSVRIALYICIHIVLAVLFTYYVIAFCSVYRNSQDEWIVSGLISFGLGMGLPFVYCYVFSLIRVGSLWFKSELLFRMSEMISYIFA